MTSKRKLSALLVTLCLLGALAVTGCGRPAEAPEQEPQPASAAPADDGATQKSREMESDRAESEELEAADEAPAAAAPMQSEPGGASAELMASYQTLEDLTEQLSQALSTADCGAASRHRDAICELAERICELADEVPSSARGSERCEDGRGRCARARRRVDQRCP